MGKWKPGTYTTEALRSRLQELLEIVKLRLEADRQAGRLKIAEEGEELLEVVHQYHDLMENSQSASRETIKVLEEALKEETR